MKSVLQSKLYCSDLQVVSDKIDWSALECKTILITGGLGLIGAAVADVLQINSNVTIVIAARNEKKFHEHFGACSNVRFLEYDSLKPLSIDFVPDFIIHGAGVTNPNQYINEPVETMLSNIQGIVGLLNFSREHHVQRLLYISSSEVYGKRESNEEILENNYGVVGLDSLRSSYPVAKSASELLCKSYSAEYGVDTVIVRPGHIVGPTASDKDCRISSDFLLKAANGQNLEMKSAGLQKRSYCYSLDCALALITVLLKGEPGEAYNIGHKEITTIVEMASMAAEAGRVTLTSIKPTKEEINAFNPMNNSSLNDWKLRKLGFENCFSVKEGITHTVRILEEGLN